MGAAQLNFVNDMEGPNAVKSNPEPLVMDLDSWDINFQPGDFVCPLEVFPNVNSNNSMETNQQKNATPENILGDWETCPIDLEKLLQDCIVDPDEGVSRRDDSLELPELPLSEEAFQTILAELQEIPALSNFPLSPETDSPPPLEPVPTFQTSTNVDLQDPATTATLTVNPSALELTGVCQTMLGSSTRTRTKRAAKVAIPDTEEEIAAPKRTKPSPRTLETAATPEDLKRQRNKEASRKSRQKRKLKDAEMNVEAEKLEKQNQTLREHIGELEQLKRLIEVEIKKKFPNFRK